MRLRIVRAFVRPAMLAAFTTGLITPSMPASAAGAPAPGVTRYAATDVGLARQVTASPANAASPRARATATQRSHGSRIRARALAAATTRHGAANALDAGTDRPQTALSANFNGVSSLDSEVTNFGATFQPPDQGLCEGNGFVLEPVNSAYTIYRRNGTPIAGPFNVNVLFQDGLLQFTSDPRCYFDGTTNTWFATILFIADDGNSSRQEIAVNPSGDPTAAWTVYKFDTTDAGGNGCPCFGDQPRLGIDQFNLYISTDEFSIAGPQFNGPQLYAVAKSDLVHLRPAAHIAHFGNLSIGGSVPVAVEPAITSGSSDAEYFLNSLDPTGTGDTRLGVWAMTDREAVARGDAPSLSSIVIGSELYAIPPQAIQRGSANLLDSGDDRMQQTQFIGGSLWGELGTAVSAGGGAPRAGAAWFRVTPRLEDGQLGGAALASQGYLAVSGKDLLYPALQADRQGNAAMVVTLSGADLFPSAAYATLNADRSGFGSVKVAAEGTGPYVHSSSGNRWGDYSWAQLDPRTDTVWLATEYIPDQASQTDTGLNNWGTRVLAVTLSGQDDGNHGGGGGNH